MIHGIRFDRFAAGRKPVNSVSWVCVLIVSRYPETCQNHMFLVSSECFRVSPIPGALPGRESRIHGHWHDLGHVCGHDLGRGPWAGSSGHEIMEGLQEVPREAPRSHQRVWGQAVERNCIQARHVEESKRRRIPTKTNLSATFGKISCRL